MMRSQTSHASASNLRVLSLSVVHHPGVIRGEGALDSTPHAVGSKGEPKNLMKGEARRDPLPSQPLPRRIDCQGPTRSQSHPSQFRSNPIITATLHLTPRSGTLAACLTLTDPRTLADGNLESEVPHPRARSTPGAGAVPARPDYNRAIGVIAPARVRPAA